jgi:hypothetical protein
VNRFSSRLSRFTLSLIVQAVLIAVAVCLLDSGVAAINMTALCTVWNLLLMLDWALCRSGCFRRNPMMLSLAAWVLSGLPVAFFGIALSVNWEM